MAAPKPNLNPALLSYARSDTPSAQSILFVEDADALNVIIPQPGVVRSVLSLAVALVIILGFCAMVLIAVSSDARDGPLLFLFGLGALYALLHVISKIHRTAAAGRRPIVLTFSFDSLTLDSPRDFGGNPRRILHHEAERWEVNSARTASWALQVTLALVLRTRERVFVTFYTRDKRAVSRLVDVVRLHLSC